MAQWMALHTLCPQRRISFTSHLVCGRQMIHQVLLQRQHPIKYMLMQYLMQPRLRMHTFQEDFHEEAEGDIDSEDDYDSETIKHGAPSPVWHAASRMF